MSKAPEQSIETRLAQACHYIDQATGAINPPLHLSSTYARGEAYEFFADYSYSRSGNPTWPILEQVCADLDGGADALCFASGMAAVCAVLETLDAGDHVVAPRIMYHGTQDWLRRMSEKRAIDLTLLEASGIEALEAAVKPGKTAMIWLETPTNPTWDVIDIEAVAAIARAAGATLVVDATVSSPITTRALEHGADIVFHSATKYLNGHSDVVAGILVTAQRDARWQEIELLRTLMGGILGPFEAWLVLRGMRTLALRFERACENALRLARHFEGHSRIERVLYPGLESHPGHEVAKKQMRHGFGGMVSLLIEGGADEARTVAAGTRIFVPATSLGGVESLIEHRASVEGPHSAVPKNLVRLSLGIENGDELIADLEQSLDRLS